jgi:hypothetical protein
MNWQQKLAAIIAFAGHYRTSLKMRDPGDWYVEAAMSVGGDGMLTGSYGNGTTPEEAVDNHWRIYSELPANRYAVNHDNKRARWNGFMWVEVTEEQAKALQAESAK